MADGAGPSSQAARLKHLAALGIYFRPELEGPMPETGHLFERWVRHVPDGLMPLGAYSYTNSIFRPVKRIGRYSSIAAGVRVMGASHPVDWVSTNPIFYRARPNKLMGGSGKDLPEYGFRPHPVTIGNDVWIGQDVLLAGGVKIGDGAVIAAGAVVTKDVAPYSVMGGVPAGVIRQRFPEEIAQRLQTLAWWRFDINSLEGLDPSDPTEFADGLEKRIEIGTAIAMSEDRRTLANWLDTPIPKRGS